MWGESGKQHRGIHRQKAVAILLNCQLIQECIGVTKKIVKSWKASVGFSGREKSRRHKGKNEADTVQSSRKASAPRGQTQRDPTCSTQKWRAVQAKKGLLTACPTTEGHRTRASCQRGGGTSFSRDIQNPPGHFAAQCALGNLLYQGDDLQRSFSAPMILGFCEKGSGDAERCSCLKTGSVSDFSLESKGTVSVCIEENIFHSIQTKIPLAGRLGCLIISTVINELTCLSPCHLGPVIYCQFLCISRMGSASPEYKNLCWKNNLGTLKSKYIPLCVLQHTPFCRRVMSFHSLHPCTPNPSRNKAVHTSQTRLPLKALEFYWSQTLRINSCFVSKTKGQGRFPLFFI